MSDIVERLRVVSPDDYDECCSVMGRAADDITKLRVVLRNLLDASERHIFSTECQAERDAARAALQSNKIDCSLEEAVMQIRAELDEEEVKRAALGERT